MAMDVSVTNLDGNGNVKTTLPQTSSASGYNRPLGEVDAGRVTGSAYLLAAEVSEDYRIRSELDTIMDAHVFNETAQFTGKHAYYTTTLTNSWSGNALTTNSGASTAINSGTLFQTYQYFPIFGGAETYAYFNLAFTGTWAVTNTTVDVGLFHNLTKTTPYAPVDGVYIRANNTGLFGVACFNGTEQTTAPFKVSSSGANFSPTLGTYYDVIVTCGQNIVVFWMDLRDGNGYTRVGSLADAAGAGLPLSVSYVPFSIRHAIGGTAASAVMSAKCASYTISQGGFQNTRSEQVTASLASGGQQGQAGQTQGQLTNYTNSLVAGAGAAMTNATAALGTGLGGQFSALPTLAVGTDGIVCSYQNPTPTSSQAGRQLVVRGVNIQSVVTTTLANTGPVVFVFALAFGHTNVNLATTETAAAKSPRRIPLGVQTFAVNAAAGAIGGVIQVKFDQPIPINPSEFVAITAKNLGTVTTAGVVTFLVSFDAGFVM